MYNLGLVYGFRHSDTFACIKVLLSSIMFAEDFEIKV